MQSNIDKNYRDKREENLERRHVYSYTDEEFFARLPIQPTYGHDICYYHRWRLQYTNFTQTLSTESSMQFSILSLVVVSMLEEKSFVSLFFI